MSLLIRDILARARAERRPSISFEFFPIKSEEGERTLFEKTIPALGALKPDFCFVTYGAGGGTRDKTLGIVERMQRDHGLTTMAHLTCVNATEEDTRAVLADAAVRGIRNILALRGDPPKGQDEFTTVEGGFSCALDLVRHIRATHGDHRHAGIARSLVHGHLACVAAQMAATLIFSLVSSSTSTRVSARVSVLT